MLSIILIAFLLHSMHNSSYPNIPLKVIVFILALAVSPKMKEKNCRVNKATLKSNENERDIGVGPDDDDYGACGAPLIDEFIISFPLSLAR